MNGKMGFAVAAVAILMAASMVPVVGSQHWVDIEKNRENEQRQPSIAGAATKSDAEMVEVPVQIHTLDGVKKITRELPIGEVRALSSLFNQTRRAVQTLQASQASSIQKQRAHEVIDTFLRTLKERGLLGDVSVAKMKSLITGGYRTAQKDEAGRPLTRMAHLFEQNRWRMGATCFFHAWGTVGGLFPHNFPLFIAMNIVGPDRPLIQNAFLLLSVGLGLTPCPTTIGYWRIRRAGMFNPSGGIEVRGLGGGGSIELNGGESIEAITVGFTGIIGLHNAIGFCPFIAYKHHT